MFLLLASISQPDEGSGSRISSVHAEAARHRNAGSRFAAAGPPGDVAARSAALAAALGTDRPPVGTMVDRGPADVLAHLRRDVAPERGIARGRADPGPRR